MFILKVDGEFCAAHRLPNYEGHCSRLHGHTWKVTAAFKATEVDERTGIAFDFAIAKQMLRGLLQQLDHRNLNGIFANPTAELIAQRLYTKLRVGLQMRKQLGPVTVHSVTVWESSRARVTYSEE